MNAVAQPRKLRVGVTLAVRDERQSLWENGIFQNCAFLAQLLNLSPAVEKAVIVTSGTQMGGGMLMDGTGLEFIPVEHAMPHLDVVIEMSALLSPEWVAAFREKGGRNAWMRVGNDYVIDIERAMFDKPAGVVYSRKAYDAVWTLPQYEVTCRDYFGTVCRAPVRFLPHLWTPYFFDLGIASLPESSRFGYQPGRERWRVCTVEPNVCSVKAGVIPLLVCEEAYRAKPALLDTFRACNTFQLKEHEQYVNFALALDIVKHGIATFEGRIPLYEFLAHHADCIVSHQWENAQNYAYYEALYGNYPLVHNSPMMRSHGYYYPSFDCQAGGQALLRAHAEHDMRLASERQSTRELLRTLDVANPPNVQAYTRELLALYE
jgi:hypothetical protein